MVELLLDLVDRRSVYEAALLAVSLGHDEMAELILDHPQYAHIEKSMAQCGCTRFLLQHGFCCDEMVSDGYWYPTTPTHYSNTSSII